MTSSAPSQRNAARTAGISLLLVLAIGIFAQAFVLLRLPADDAATTARNILSQQTLFRCGVTAALLSAACGLVEIWALFLLLRPFREGLALLALLMTFAGSLVFIDTMHDNFLVIHLLRSAGSDSAFTAAQLQSAAQLLLAHDDGLRTSLVFSSVGQFLFGWLFFRSRYIPRALSGYFMFANGFVFASCISLNIAPTSDRFLFPWFALANFLAMLSLGLWLAVRGAATPAGPPTPDA